LAVDLRGVRDDRFGLGARVRVVLPAGARERVLHRVVGSGGSFGASPLRLHFGLGTAVRIAALEVDWPLGERQRFTAVPLDATVVVHQGQTLLERR